MLQSLVSVRIIQNGRPKPATVKFNGFTVMNENDGWEAPHRSNPAPADVDCLSAVTVVEHKEPAQPAASQAVPGTLHPSHTITPPTLPSLVFKFC